MRAYPPAANTFTVFGTNIVFGGIWITNQPTAAGFFSNSISPNSYQVQIPALSVSFYVTIPNTTNYNSLGLYITNAPQVGPPFLGYAVNNFAGITNALAYFPATNTYSVIVAALGYPPLAAAFATNTTIFISGVTGITNGSGYVTNLSLTYFTHVLIYQVP